jgi:hypothetical protein
MSTLGAFPQSAIGLPQSLKYDLPPSLSDSARSYSVNVSPDGITSVTGGAIAGLFAANTTANFGAFNSQVVSFTIPSGMSDSVFMDTNATTLSFTMTYTVSTASSATAPLLKLIGGAHTFFDQLVLYSNNTPIETINQYGLLQNFLLNNTVNSSERNGGISVSMGADSNSLNGIDLAHSVLGTYRYNFCIPLCSVIGYNSDKMFPVGSINNLQLQMTTANLYPLVSYCTAAATAGAIAAGVTLSEFSLNMKYVDIGDMAANLLKQTLQDGKWMIKATTYTNSAVTIPTGSSGAQQLLLQIRNSSVKSVIHQFGIAAGAVCPNGVYDAVNPSLNSRQLQVGGQFFPNKPINDSQRPAEGYAYLIQSMGANIPKALGTAVNRDSYNVVIPSVPAGSDSSLVVPAAGVRPNAQNSDNTAIIASFPHMAYYGYDLEKSSGILFQGVNTRASPPFLNLNLAQATTSTIQCQAFGMSDVVLVVDTISKQVQAFV